MGVAPWAAAACAWRAHARACAMPPGLPTVAHPKLPVAVAAMVVVSPERARVFAAAGWDRARLLAELDALLQLAGTDIARGVDGIAEGLPEALSGLTLPKFRPGGLLLTHAGGGAGMFPALIGGWVSGATGSEPVTKEVAPWL